MKIAAGDAAIVYTGPEVLLLCKIPDDQDDIPNKQQAANAGSKRLLYRKGGIFDLSKVIDCSYGQKVCTVLSPFPSVQFFWDSSDRWSVLLQPTGELITRTVTHRTQILVCLGFVASLCTVSS